MGRKEYKTKKDFFREYALCSCLLQVSNGDSAKIKDASKAVYYDIADDELSIANAGQRIDSNAAMFIAQRQNPVGKTYENRKTPVLDCITYSKSKELHRFLDSLMFVERRSRN